MPIKDQLAAAKRTIQDKLYGKTKDTSTGVQAAELADARRGIVYFLGNTTTMRGGPKLDFGVVGNFVGNTEAVQDVAKGAMWLVDKVTVARNAANAVKAKATALKDWGAEKLKGLTDLIASFLQKLQSALASKYGFLIDACDSPTECFGWLTSTFTKTLADLIPGWGYVQNAADVYAGAKTACDGAWRGIQQLYSGWGVALLGGHPSIIANALGRHAIALVGGGLKDVAIASGKIAMMAAGDAAAGVGSLVQTIAEILQKIAGLVEKLVQRFLLNRVLRHAAEQWKIRDNGSSLIADHKAFSEWFQGAVIGTPVIAALALNSGFCAHPYRFLQMLSPSDEVITQAQFDQGVAHIHKLKKLGGQYVREYIEAYGTSFQSADKLVEARLQAVINGDGILHTA